MYCVLMLFHTCCIILPLIINVSSVPQSFDHHVDIFIAAMSATDQYNKLSHDRNLKIKHLKVNSRNPNGETVLHIACRMNDVTSAARLINAGAKTTKKDQNGDIALHIAVRNGNPDIVKLFLPKSGEVQSSQLKDLVNNEGETALHIAASMGHAHIIKDLILAGWNPNVRDKCGRTYIHHACSRGFGPSVIKQLKPYRHNKQDTSSNEIHAIEWVFNCTDNDGKTPLHYACEAGSMELVEELCKLGEDPKFEDQKLMTKNDGGCLHLAASSGCINLVLFLIETCHIDPSLKGHYGENILHRACANGRTELVQKLIEKKYADIHAQDAIGLTPLHWAMINQQSTIAHILVNDHDCSLLSTCDVKSILESGLPSKYYFEREKLLEAFMLISINDR